MARRWLSSPRATRSDNRGPGEPESDAGMPEWVFDAPEEHDTPAEVDAAMRTVRRVSIWHCAVFLGVVLLVPFLTIALDWWSQGQLLGGMSPNFAMAAVGLYVFFFVHSVAAARLSNAVESRMLGHSTESLHDVVDDDARDGDTRDGDTRDGDSG